MAIMTGTRVTGQSTRLNRQPPQRGRAFVGCALRSKPRFSEASGAQGAPYVFLIEPPVPDHST
jgi:hypothetical protein